MKSKSGRVAFTALLAALALALSFLEGLLPPLPMMPPGAKLGLSNLATMYAAGSLGLPSALFLAVFKGAFALVTRGGMAGLMSLSGGVVSTVVMWLLLKKPTPLWGWWASAGPWPTTPPSCAWPTSSPAPAWPFTCPSWCCSACSPGC